MPRNEETTSALREQLRSGLRHRQAFDRGQLFTATDVLEQVVHSAVEAITRASSPGFQRDGWAVVTAASVAASAVRNGELLASLRSTSEIHSFAEMLRSAAQFGHSKLEVAANGARRKVEYSQLYVPPDLAYSRVPAPGSLFEGYGSLSVSELLDLERNLVILGDPGAGKSTLAAKLTHDLAADVYERHRGQVPLLLKVRDFSQGIRTDHEPLMHYLHASCRRPRNLLPPPGAIEYLLLNGLGTVIIDGVDELGDSSARESFFDLVQGFVHLYPLARVIVTSRRVGYGEASLDPSLFSTFELRPFDSSQVAEYVVRWFRLDTFGDDNEAEILADGFMQQSELASDLRSNALLLSLLCSLYSAVRYIPTNRPEIYNKCANLLFENWDRQRGIEVAHRYESHIRPAVQKMAIHLFRDAQGRQALPRSEWMQFLTSYLQSRRFPNVLDAELAASDFLDFCAGRAWVITDVGSDQFEPHYGFVHPTFLEYFTAAQLVKERPRPAEVFGKIEPHLGDVSWRMVSQLAVQILNDSFDDGADELIKFMLINHRARARTRAGQDVYLNFIASLMEVVAPHNDSLEDAVGRIVTASCQVPVAERFTTPTEPAPRKYDPVAAVGPVDEPFLALLGVTMAENAERIASAIARNLWACAADPLAHPSVGPLWVALQQTICDSFEVARTAAELLSGQRVPAVVSDWRRQLQWPAAGDLATGGIAVLYRQMYCLGVLSPTPLNEMIHEFERAADAPTAQRRVARRISLQLRDYLTYLNAHPDERAALDLLPSEMPEDTWVLIVQNPDWLDSEARLSLKSLLWRPR